MTTMSTWLGVQGIELYGGTADEYDDAKTQLQVRFNRLTPEDWRKGVFKTLQCLYTSPCQTSVPILQAINAASMKGNKVTITPSGPRDERLPGRPDSTGAGWDGAGELQFIAQDHDNPDRAATLHLADEDLLHELVHAMRTFGGITDLRDLPAKPPNESQDYNNYDDFCAIVIANIYRSENRRPGLRKDHQEPTRDLGRTYSDPRQFASLWRDPLLLMQRQLGSIFTKIAMVQCPFNPFSVLQR
jgi:hypothetical protein